jgi:hypothetical protein
LFYEAWVYLVLGERLCIAHRLPIFGGAIKSHASALSEGASGAGTDLVALHDPFGLAFSHIERGLHVLVLFG